MGSSLAQIGRVLIETGRYGEALDHLLSALMLFIELESPKAETA